MKDLLIYETANGGDMAIQNNDVALGDSLLQQVYLRLFGGNVEAVTKGNEPATEERRDWWGNALFFAGAKERQFNSATEKALRDTERTSSGRLKIVRAVQSDLQYLGEVATVTVDVAMTPMGWKISIQMVRPAAPGLSLQVLWDSAKGEAVIVQTV